MEEYAEITISELAIKCRSKKRSLVFYEMKEQCI